MAAARELGTGKRKLARLIRNVMKCGYERRRGGSFAATVNRLSTPPAHGPLKVDETDTCTANGG